MSCHTYFIALIEETDLLNRKQT